MKFFWLVPFIISFAAPAKAQDSTIRRNVICFTPTQANKINGLAIGLWNSPEYWTQRVNGINFELVGQGWTTIALPMDDGGYVRKSWYSQTINGVSLGLTLFNGKVNGLSISPTINTTYHVNGAKIGLFNFDLGKTNGLQFGLINANYVSNGLTLGLYNDANSFNGMVLGIATRSKSFNGFQFGLINTTSSKLSGVQLGIYNKDIKVSGLSVGVCNNASDVRGVQFGLINIAHDLRGMQIGLININRSRTMILCNWSSRRE